MAQVNTKIIITTIILILVINLAFAATKTLRVEETEFVKINPKAVDPDGDQVSYEFFPPLDQEGEWQTDYGDAGEYNLRIIASDGVNKIIEYVRLVVEEKNQPPYLTEKKVTVKETQTIDLKTIIKDPNNDPLSYTFNEPFDENGKWETDYDDEGNFITTIMINDGEFNVEKKVEIEIINTNQPPTITDSFSSAATVETEEDQEFSFWVEAFDADTNKPLHYLWKLGDKTISREKSAAYNFDYESAGEYLLKLTIGDKELTSEKEWTIIVKNKNRKPRFSHLPITVKEGEKVVLDLPEIDEDDDSITYSFEKPFDQNGEWQTNYNSAGEYSLRIIASDGDLENNEKVEITVLNVDRPPILILPEELEVNEREELVWRINTEDPDGDRLEIKINNVPEDSTLNQENKTLTWKPDYDAIERKYGIISDVLNVLRLEHSFLQTKIIPLEIEVCGRELCNSGKLNLLLHNTNREPVIETVNNLTVRENELVEISADVYDPDGDIVEHRFDSPLSKRKGKWQTDYEDEGNYTLYVTATDGHLETKKEVQLEVLKDNREPTLKIEDDEIKIKEGEEFMFKVDAADPDHDPLEITLGNIPPGAYFSKGVFSWEPSYDLVGNESKETVWLEFTASDEEFATVHPVKVIVKNVNQKPEIVNAVPEAEIRAKLNEPILFKVVAEDYDNHKLKYEWDFGLGQGKVTGTNTVERTFLVPGNKRVKVTISDGKDKVEHEWVVRVSKEEPFTVGIYVIEV